MGQIIFTFHEGPNGHRVPDYYYEELDAAGKIFALKITDAEPNPRAIEVARQSSLPHVIIFRRSMGVYGDWAYDVPRYDKTIRQAAVDHWRLHENELPSIVRDNRDLVWVTNCNEPDKNRAEWLAGFSIETYNIAHQKGYKYLSFGWAGGEPEIEHWKGPTMLEFLRLAGVNRASLGIDLHEYALSKDIWNKRAADGSFWHIGRFTHLLDVCQQNRIPRPTIHVTEWGYGRDTGTLVTDQAQRMRDYLDVGTLYAQKAPGMSAAAWCLNGGEWGTIGDNLIKDVRPLTDLILQTEIETPEEPDMPEAKSKRVIMLAPQKTELSRAEKQLVDDAAWDEYGRTVTLSAEDARDMALGGNDESYVIVFWPQRSSQQAAIRVLEAAGVRYETRFGDVAQDFRFTHWPTVERRVTQMFRSNPKNYAQFGLPGHEGIDIAASEGSPIRAVTDGIVYEVHPAAGGNNYGIHIRIEHDDPATASKFYTVYGHLSRIAPLAVGTAVRGGEVIGYAGNTGNSFGSHLHLTLKRKGPKSYMDKCGIHWPYDIIDPTPYMLHFDGVKWLAEAPCPDSAPQPPAPAPGPRLDVISYQIAHPAAFRVVYATDINGGNRRGQDVQDFIYPDRGDGIVRVARSKTSSPDRDSAEFWAYRGDHAYLVADTSHSKDLMYIIKKDGVAGLSPKNPRMMRVGETWQETDPHWVQFLFKSNCALYNDPPTGSATNFATLLWHNPAYVFPKLPVSFDAICLLTPNGEEQIYAKINAAGAAHYKVPVGTSVGWVGWRSPWGLGLFEELYFTRGQLTQAPRHFCDFGF